MYLPKSRHIILAVLALAVAVPAMASGAGSGAGSTLISSIGISIIAATVLGLIAQKLRQPLILAYILAGVIIGPEIGPKLIPSRGDVEVISEIGLILLLFIIGLEMDMKKLKTSGRALILTGTFQFAICAALGVAVLPFIVPGTHGYPLFYLAACLALSSTAIVVKLLFTKSEIDTIPGRITLGILIFQDLWAIILLAIQPNLAHPNLVAILVSFGKGAILVAASLLVSRYILPRLFRFIALVPELLLVASLGWCFIVCAAASALGLSVEMGALIAGIGISTFPYNLDVIAKVISIRDFFVTLFFVSLGMKIPNPLANPAIIVSALGCSAFLILTRFLSVSPILYSLKQGHRISLIPAINLANVSEFSLVIAALGVSAGHIGQDTLTLIIFVFVITSIAAPYMIQWNTAIQKGLERCLRKAGLRGGTGQEDDANGVEMREIAILGFYRVASSLVRSIQEAESHAGKKREESVLHRMMVVDFNPNLREKLEAHGIRLVYADLSNKDTLRHIGLSRAKLIISTVPDTMLVGTDNLTLARQLRELAPKAKLVVNAESPERARKMYAEGADYVLLSRDIIAENLRGLIPALMDDEQSRWIRDMEIAALSGVEEIVS